MNDVQHHLDGLRFKWHWIGEGREDYEKGKASEEKFLALVLSLMKEQFPWLVFIKKADLFSDYIGKVDFNLNVFAEGESGRKYFKIRIQVKSSLFGAQQFRKKNPRSKAHIIIMDEHMNSQRLSQELNRIYLHEIYKRYHPTLLSA